MLPEWDDREQSMPEYRLAVSDSAGEFSEMRLSLNGVSELDRLTR